MWSYDTKHSAESSPAIANGKVFVSAGRIYCFGKKLTASPPIHHGPTPSQPLPPSTAYITRLLIFFVMVLVILSLIIIGIVVLIRKRMKK